MRFILGLVVVAHALRRKRQPVAQAPSPPHTRGRLRRLLGRYGSAALAVLTLVVLALQLRTFDTQTKILSIQHSADVRAQSRTDDAAELSELARVQFSVTSTTIVITNANAFAIGDPVVWGIGSNAENDFDTVEMRLPILRPCTAYTLTKADIAAVAVQSQLPPGQQTSSPAVAPPVLKEAHMVIGVPDTGHYWLLSDGDAVAGIEPAPDTVRATSALIESYDFGDTYDEGADHTRDFDFDASLSAANPGPLTGRIGVHSAHLGLHAVTTPTTCR